ncbi:MAG: hypothetical protein AAGA68_18490 [Pseudomonadota bacterium]
MPRSIRHSLVLLAALCALSPSVNATLIGDDIRLRADAFGGNFLDEVAIGDLFSVEFVSIENSRVDIDIVDHDTISIFFSLGPRENSRGFSNWDLTFSDLDGPGVVDLRNFIAEGGSPLTINSFSVLDSTAFRLGGLMGVVNDANPTARLTFDVVFATAITEPMTPLLMLLGLGILASTRPTRTRSA